MEVYFDVDLFRVTITNALVAPVVYSISVIMSVILVKTLFLYNIIKLAYSKILDLLLIEQIILS